MRRSGLGTECTVPGFWFQDGVDDEVWAVEVDPVVTCLGDQVRAAGGESGGAAVECHDFR